jgi:hypothetical protein
MDEFRVPRREQSVRVVLDDGRSIEADMFAALTGPDGRPGRILDRLNDSAEAFLPVRSGEDRLLLNKSGMVTIQVEGTAEEVMGPEHAAGREVPVRIGMAGGAGLVGRLLIVMPLERSRVVDYLNDVQEFFPLIGEGQVTLVQKRFVVSVRELEGS